MPVAYVTPVPEFDSPPQVCGTCYATVYDRDVLSHAEWHVQLDSRIAAAANVGSYADSMIRPIGSSG
jgi:hypothetical protein